MSAGREIMNTAMQVARQEARSFASTACVGEVTSVDPLKVKLQDGLELSEDFLVVSCFCKETVIKIPQNDDYEHTHECKDELGFSLSASVDLTDAGIPVVIPVSFISVPSGTEPTDNAGSLKNIDFKHHHVIEKALPSIMLWRGIQKGDLVLMIKFPPYKFLILQRMEGITNDPDGQ